MLARIMHKTSFTLAVSAMVLVVGQGPVQAYESPMHVFSVHDVMGGFDGSTFGTKGATQDPSIICDLGSEPCPEDNGPIVAKAGVTLYPVDSEFGY